MPLLTGVVGAVIIHGQGELSCSRASRRCRAPELRSRFWSSLVSSMIWRGSGHPGVQAPEAVAGAAAAGGRRAPPASAPGRSKDLALSMPQDPCRRPGPAAGSRRSGSAAGGRRRAGTGRGRVVAHRTAIAERQTRQGDVAAIAAEHAGAGGNSGGGVPQGAGLVDDRLGGDLGGLQCPGADQQQRQQHGDGV